MKGSVTLVLLGMLTGQAVSSAVAQKNPEEKKIVPQRKYTRYVDFVLVRDAIALTLKPFLDLQKYKDDLLITIIVNYAHGDAHELKEHTQLEKLVENRYGESAKHLVEKACRAISKKLDVCATFGYKDGDIIVVHDCSIPNETVACAAVKAAAKKPSKRWALEERVPLRLEGRTVLKIQALFE